MNIKLILGDCLEKLKEISDNSVDLILTDPPYGVLHDCKWDKVIPLNEMWVELNRVIKKDKPIILFASQPFSSELIVSNIPNFKYEWIWEKNIASGFLNAKKRPLKMYEQILVFNNKDIYYPQGLISCDIKYKPKIRATGAAYSSTVFKPYTQSYTNYPKNILKFNKPPKAVHPTQKPVDLLEYLIKTYSVEGDTVLDFTMGSGSTGVACKNTSRGFIGIELDENYYSIAKERLYE